jgi:putative ABC transport system ATP-binding protein
LKEKLLLIAENISHAFSGSPPLFENLNLSLSPSESIAIIGVSGSGKSTLLHILSGTIEPNSGTVSHFQNNFWKQKKRDREAIRRKDIGVIFQFHYLFKGFTALENLQVASLLAGEEIDMDLLEKFGISHLTDHKVTQLSGGEQQRVSIARVLTKRPKMIFADELTGNLDRETASNVMNTLFQYIKKERAGMVLVTHDENLASKCDRVFKLSNGEFTEVESFQNTSTGA